MHKHSPASLSTCCGRLYKVLTAQNRHFRYTQFLKYNREFHRTVQLSIQSQLFQHTAHSSPMYLSCKIAIAGLNLPSFSLLNYLIYSSIQDNSLVITLKSSKMNWKKATIWMILHSRKDILSKISLISIQNVIKQSTPAQKTPLLLNLQSMHKILSTLATF